MRRCIPDPLVDQVIHWGYAAFMWGGAVCLLALAVLIFLMIWRGE